MKNYYVYITTNSNSSVLYIGVSNCLKKRIQEHFLNANHSKTSFAGKYNCHHLLYFEVFTSIVNAIAREKELKGWKRNKKMELIKISNPSLQFIEPTN